ncbi:hypothetical protein D3C76_1714580 [compost metagenome]
MQIGVKITIHRGLTGMMETSQTNSDVAITHKVMDFKWQPFSITLERANVASITAVDNRASVR